MRRYLIDVRTWQVFKLEFNEDKELVDIEKNAEFNLTETGMRDTLAWSRVQLKGKALVEVLPNMAFVTPTYMLYNTEANKVKFVRLLRKDKQDDQNN